MKDQGAMEFINQVKDMAKEEMKQGSTGYIKVVPARVVGISGDNAVVRLSYAPADGSADFTIPIITRQTISVNDAVNVAYWGNLSTGIVLSKG